MDSDRSIIEHVWRERGVSPVVLLYLVGVFVVFIAVAHLVFGSADAVKALLLAAIGSVAATVPGVLRKTEYLLTRSGLSKRALRPGDPRKFEEIFTWGELSHVVPTKSGFKFYRSFEEPSRLRRWYKAHLMADCSGEFQVGPRDRAQVNAIIDARGVPRAKPRGAIRAGG